MLTYPRQRLRSSYVLKPDIAKTSYCCSGVTMAMVRAPSHKLRRVGLLDPSELSAPSMVCALIWSTYRLWNVHSCGNTRCINQIFQRKCGRENTLNVSGSLRYRKAFDLTSQYDANASEEETTGINVLRSFVFREALFHYTPYPVGLIIHSTLKRR